MKTKIFFKKVLLFYAFKVNFVFHFLNHVNVVFYFQKKFDTSTIFLIRIFGNKKTVISKDVISLAFNIVFK